MRAAILAALLWAPVPAFAAEQVVPTRTCGHYFIVDATIEGRGPYPLILDTGASTTVLSPEVVRAARPGRKRIRELSFGPLTARRVRYIRRRMDDLSHVIGTRIEGIVGQPVFGKLTVVYDYPALTVRLREERLDPGDPETVPASKGARPFIAAQVGERRVPLLIDTGSGHGLSLRDLATYPLREPLRPVSGKMRIDGMYRNRAGRLAGDVRFGPVRLRTPLANDSVSVNLLGQRVLSRYVLSIDGPGRRVGFHLAQGGHEPIEPEPLYGLGILFRPGAEFFEVAEILPGSTADEAGVRVGDRIHSVGGRPIVSCDPLPAPDPALPVMLGIERAGERLEIELRPPVLVP